MVLLISLNTIPCFFITFLSLELQFIEFNSIFSFKNAIFEATLKATPPNFS